MHPRKDTQCLLKENNILKNKNSEFKDKEYFLKWDQLFKTQVKKFFSKQCAIKAMAQLRDEGLVFIVPAIFIFIVPDTQESEILKPSKESLNIALIVMHF